MHVAEELRRATGGRDVLWYGRPDATVVLRQALLLWLLGIPFVLLSLLWFGSVLGVLNPKAEWHGAWSKIGGALFGLPFFAIGCVGVLAPIWAWWEARNTGFAITDAGLTRVVALPSGRVEAQLLAFAEVLEINRRDGRRGFGTLALLTGWERDSDGDLTRKEEVMTGIPDVRMVEDMLRSRLRPGAVREGS